jgi:hypothetical protein
VLKTILPLIGPAIAILIIAWRMRRATKGRPLKPNRLWIRPAVLVVIVGLMLLHPAPITLRNVAIVGGALAVGVGLGYFLASHQHLTIDPATGAITSKLSPVGVLLFLALIAVRYAVRFATVGDGETGHLSGPQLDAMLVYTDAALFFALGLVSAQSWEIWRRAKALLTEAGAGKASTGAE